ncbi:MAG: uroporphyrinogen-III C-methyltransferase [Candidatus Dormibacteria bacterium]
MRASSAGSVHLVGAGPGDPGLITVRGARLLAEADAVFHDQLVGTGILEMVRPGADLVAVGHRAGMPRASVDAVVSAMATAHTAGARVVRLKGGDPFVFGRGAEEVEALLSLGIPVEVVPGISSAFAGPLAAGIPVTHRGLAASVMIVTGHRPGDQESVDWGRVGNASDTLVVLMGTARLGEIAEALIAAGRPSGTPAAVVASATLPTQRRLLSSLGEIAGLAAHEAPPPPAILVVGEVVRMARADASGPS